MNLSENKRHFSFAIIIKNTIKPNALNTQYKDTSSWTYNKLGESKTLKFLQNLLLLLFLHSVDKLLMLFSFPTLFLLHYKHISKNTFSLYNLFQKMRN